MFRFVNFLVLIIVYKSIKNTVLPRAPHYVFKRA